RHLALREPLAFRSPHRRGGRAISAQVRRDHRVALGQDRDDATPAVVRLGEPMEQKRRRAAAGGGPQGAVIPRLGGAGVVVVPRRTVPPRCPAQPPSSASCTSNWKCWISFSLVSRRRPWSIVP